MHWSENIMHYRMWAPRVKRLNLNEEEWKPVFVQLAEAYDNYKKKQLDPNYYLRNIFPLVLRIFKAEMSGPELPGVLRKEKMDYDLLIQPVGFSIEPLLLSALTIKPKEKLLLLYSGDTYESANLVQRTLFRKNYNGFNPNDLAEEEWEYMESLNNKNVVLKKVDPLDLYDFFLKLKDDLADIYLNRIAVDITGGKKSLSSALFNLATMFKLDAFYIDFEKYEGRLKIPFPGTEFLNYLPNAVNLAEKTGLTKILDKEILTKKDIENWIEESKLKERKHGF